MISFHVVRVQEEPVLTHTGTYNFAWASGILKQFMTFIRDLLRKP